MATAALYDMSRIAVDPAFQGRVQAETFNYIIYTIRTEPTTTVGYQVRRNYAADVMANPNGFITTLSWAAACNQTLANDVITNGNAGANFTAATTAATVATACVSATDTDISNAVATAWNMLSNSGGQ